MNRFKNNTELYQNHVCTYFAQLDKEMKKNTMFTSNTNAKGDILHRMFLEDGNSKPLNLIINGVRTTILTGHRKDSLTATGKSSNMKSVYDTDVQNLIYLTLKELVGTCMYKFSKNKTVMGYPVK